MNRSLLSMSFAPRRHRTQTAFMLPDPKFFAGVLLHVDGKSDRWRSEVMLMVRIDHPTRKEVPFAGFHLAQSWQPWHSLGVKAGCESLRGIERVHHVFHCGLGLRRVVHHSDLTALEAAVP